MHGTCEAYGPNSRETTRPPAARHQNFRHRATSLGGGPTNDEYDRYTLRTSRKMQQLGYEHGSNDTDSSTANARGSRNAPSRRPPVAT